jgi:hypothetical protein
LDSTPPGRLLTTRASPHRTFGLTSHRADSKFRLHLHSSSPSFYAFILHLLSSPPPTLSASSPAHRIIPPPTLGRCIPTGAAPHLTPQLTSHFTSHRIFAPRITLRTSHRTSPHFAITPLYLPFIHPYKRLPLRACGGRILRLPSSSFIILEEPSQAGGTSTSISC